VSAARDTFRLRARAYRVRLDLQPGERVTRRGYEAAAGPVGAP
jgi:hypothetical protein